MGKSKNTCLKYCAAILVLGILLYNSVYIQPLDKVSATADSQVFDPVAYAQNFWQNGLPKETARAVETSVLLNLLNSDMTQAIEKYGRTLGIASFHSFLVKGKGRITEISDYGLLISLDDDSGVNVLLMTLDLFGNAIRDASGLIDVADFANSMEFNTISVEINNIVRKDFVPQALEEASIGREVHFTGAVQLSENDPAIQPLSLIPIDIIWKE